MSTPTIVKLDPWLEPYSGIIERRHQKYLDKKAYLEHKYKSLSSFGDGHTYFGLHKTKKSWVFREYAPGASKIVLIGTFSDWKELEEFELKDITGGVWELNIPLDKLKHNDLYKMMVYRGNAKAERLPSYVRTVEQDPNTYIFSSRVHDPAKAYKQKQKHVALNGKSPFIYECHIGMGTEEEKVGSFNEFRKNILPRIHSLGYNVIQIMAIQEHPYYGSFGYHVGNFFAVSSRFGTPEDLKHLIDDAHKMEMAVILDVVHSHAVKNEVEGIANLDLSGQLYFHTDHRREHPAWDSLCFDYSREDTLKFLLSNCRYWIEEYNFDGFRFDGVTSMLYYNHGLEKAFTQYSDYYDGGQDEDAITYLTLANDLIHQIHNGAITVAEEMSGLPGLGGKIEEGGIGFDFRMAMGIPDYWIKLIKEKKDEDWNVGQIYHELTNHRAEEKTINYAESHDQALVGDKTIIFRLIDKEMYWHMQASDRHEVVDRGIALHKMIRLVTASLISGGYLNFMGNEFGHPEWIDFPREGNGWSYKHARRLWSLVDNGLLKYKQLNDFDRDMIQLLSGEDKFAEAYTGLTLCNEGDQVLVYQRKDLIFVFNFSPMNSFTNYGFKVESGKYRIILNSDDPKYGGFGLVDDKMLYYTMEQKETLEEQNEKGEVQTKRITSCWLKLYIPARTCFVLKKV